MMNTVGPELKDDECLSINQDKINVEFEKVPLYYNCFPWEFAIKIYTIMSCLFFWDSTIYEHVLMSCFSVTTNFTILNKQFNEQHVICLHSSQEKKGL